MTRTRRRPSDCRGWLPLAAALLLVAAGARADDLSERVGQAVDKGREYLLPEIARLTAAPPSDYPMGRLALPVAAALKSGAPTDDERIDSAMRKLASMDLRKTYGVACYLFALDAYWKRRHQESLRAERGRTVVGATSRQARGVVRDEIARAVAWMVEARAWGQGYWNYESIARSGAHRHDFSNTQFAVLGLQIGLEHGVAVPRDVFREIAEQFLRSLRPDGEERVLEMTNALSLEDLLARTRTRRTYTVRIQPGGWGYTAGAGAPTASMTAAGASSLLVARNGLGRAEAGLVRSIESALYGAYAWIESHFGSYVGEGTNLYTMYSLEKVGDLGSIESFGAHDWYREGAEFLLARQRDDGSWGFAGGRAVYVQTALALLFLTRATRLQADVAPRIYTQGDGEAERDRDLVYVGQLDGFISARSVLAIVARSRNSKLLEAAREVVTNYDLDHRGDLVPALLEMWTGRSDRVTRFARDTLVEVTGVRSSNPDAYIEWSEQYARVDALRAQRPVDVALARELLAQVEGPVLRGLLIRIAARHKLYDLAPELAGLLEDRDASTRRQAHSLLALWTGQPASAPTDADRDAWRALAAQWRAWADEKGARLGLERRFDELYDELRGAPPARVADVVARITALGPEAVPLVRARLEDPRHPFALIEILERLTDEEIGLR